ncbi:MAG: sensor histidine kinase [Alphaproteobacteria bacterium]|nr:sensor histidine kinase [Alphaproteobacteria bacterium]
MVPRPSPNGAGDLALAVVGASTLPVLLLDQNLNVVAASASFCSAYQIDPSTVDRRPFAELGEGEWNMPQLSGLLKATAFGFAEVANYEMSLARKSRSNRCLVVNAKKLEYAGDIRLILSIADITDARSAEKRTAALLQEKDILFQELHHRVANSLQIIASVLMQSARKVNSDETRYHLHDAHQRVMSIAALQRLLAGSNRGDVELRPYLTVLCDSIGASMIQDRDQLSLEVTVDDSIMTADGSVSLGLIVTELVINALKHAFPGNRPGRISVDYRRRGPNWTLSVKDDGVGMGGDGNAKAGLGTSIIEALAKQLGAEIKVIDAHPGTKVSIAHASVPILVARAAI